MFCDWELTLSMRKLKNKMLRVTLVLFYLRGVKVIGRGVEG